MPTTIYALCEPDLQVPVIRYIGKTVNLKKRFGDHCKPRATRKKNHLGCWLRSLQIRREKPVLMTLTEIPDELGVAAEILYIRLAREGGMDLVNSTEGGEGASGYVHSPQIRRKLSELSKAQAHTPERNLKISVATKGENNPMFGVTHSPGALKKITGENNHSFGKKRRGASSQFRGVFWDKWGKRWVAKIRVGRKEEYIGKYLSELDAAWAYDSAALEFHGPSAKLNFPVTSCGS